MSDPGVLNQLSEQIMADPDPQVRWMALSWISSGSQQAGIPLLIRALGDPAASVRHSAYLRLILNTGQSFAFNAQAPRDQRLADQACWQAWWDAQNAPELAPTREKSP